MDGALLMDHQLTSTTSDAWTITQQQLTCKTCGDFTTFTFESTGDAWKTRGVHVERFNSPLAGLTLLSRSEAGRAGGERGEERVCIWETHAKREREGWGRREGLTLIHLALPPT